MLPCSLGAQALFNGAWWLEHGRHLTGTLYCYAFIYFWALSCISFSVFCGLTKTLVSMMLCQEGWENKMWGWGVWEFVGVRKSAVVSSYYMKSLDVERLGLRRENMKATVSYSFVRPSPTDRMASIEPFTLVTMVSRPDNLINLLLFVPKHNDISL